MMFSEDDLLPISGLQHLLFCERQAALVLIENLWEENTFTADGKIKHERAHEVGTEARPGIRMARGLRLRSLTLGLSGMTDIVEFHRTGDTTGIALEGIKDLWLPVPVEYKRGRLRKEDGYELQLCAQAICLEEMLGAEIPKGYIYYGRTNRRLEIAFDEDLRQKTILAAKRLHELLSSGVTPKAAHTRKCERCSLINLCLPAVSGSKQSTGTYLKRMLKAVGEGEM
jgi:CRISPR-associated exonuclease Cas4